MNNNQPQSQPEVQQGEKEPAGLTHPQIHCDYYTWLETVKQDHIMMGLIEKHATSFVGAHALMMEAWSRSRELLAKRIKSKPSIKSQLEALVGELGKEFDDDTILQLCREAGFDERQWKAMTYDRQPYDVTVPSFALKQFVKFFKVKQTTRIRELLKGQNE